MLRRDCAKLGIRVPEPDSRSLARTNCGAAPARLGGGDHAGANLTALLRSHILTAAKLVTAAKGGDTAAVRSASDAWYANADSIADFLSVANPKAWPAATLRAAMRMHLDLTLKEATARLHGEWAADVAAYDAIHHHILQLADVLSSGIMGQFPARFH